MADNDTYVVIKEGKKKNNFALFALFGIIFFIAIYFPLFGSTLRYQTGNIFSFIFTGIGSICYTFGMMLMIWGFLLVLGTKSVRYSGMMIIGGILVLISTFLLAPGTFVGGGPEVPIGYH